MTTATLLLGLVVLLQPRPATRAEPGPDTDALARACDQLAGRWRERFEAERFASVVSPPFVLAGDGGEARLRSVRDRTVLAAQRALRAGFFREDPREPVLILLFESDGSYRRLAKAWLGDESVPHYGYFRRDNVMLMNLATGTGTLVHELTHALLRPDFPNCPDWFNEGFASLFEQCTLDGERIQGLPNWRLPALQQAIRDGQLRSLQALIEDEHFYDPDRVGLNYAQARYLMLYLQERGTLQRYYRLARDQADRDPTTLTALREVIAPQSLEEFERDWRKWVRQLRWR